MRLVFDQPDATARVVGAWIGYEIHPPYTAIAAVDDDGEFIGGAVFNGYTGFDVNMTVAGPGSFSRATIKTVLNYVFVKMGCLHLSAKTRRSNKLVRKLLEKSGFHCVCILPRHFGPKRADDAFYYRLSKKNAERWL